MGKPSNPSCPWFPDLADVTMTPQTNYSWFWRHQDASAIPRKKNSLFILFWKSENLTILWFWKFASREGRQADSCSIVKIWNCDTFFGTLKLLKFETSETLKLSKGDISISDQRNPRHPSTYRQCDNFKQNWSPSHVWWQQTNSSSSSIPVCLKVVGLLLAVGGAASATALAADSTSKGEM